jgi:hypothetical protein
MVPAVDLSHIEQRLEMVHHDQWGPEDTRYVCVLFWDDLGFRMLRNSYDAGDWLAWHESSGQFWDLFLAGCYAFADQQFYGYSGATQVLADGDEDSEDGYGYPTVYWSRTKTFELVARL